MKLLTLEDYQKAGETFCQTSNIFMLQKNLVKMFKAEDILKVMEAVGSVTATRTRRRRTFWIQQKRRRN